MTEQITFDARALTDPVDRADFAAFLRSPQAPTVVARVFTALFLTFLAAVFAFSFALNIGPVMRGNGSWVLFAVFGLGIAVLCVATVVAWRSIRAFRVRAYRLSRFASANAMQFRPEVSAPPLPGMIFNLGRSRRAESVVRGTEPRLVEFGDYQYTTGSGKNSQTHHWQYIAVHMNNALPNIVLDAKSNNALGTNLPIAFGREQRLSLEGNFDEHFALYCPVGYERDALYLFTPDVMANFMDTMGAFDVEIVDQWVFLYSRTGGRSSGNVDVWAWRFRAVHALLSKISQWERWRDDRITEGSTAQQTTFATVPGSTFAGAHASGVVPPLPPVPGASRSGVAPEGRRLRRGISWGSFAFIGAVALFAIVKNILEAVLR